MYYGICEIEILFSTRGNAWLEIVSRMSDIPDDTVSDRTDDVKLCFRHSGLKSSHIRKWNNILDFTYMEDTTNNEIFLVLLAYVF